MAAITKIRPLTSADLNELAAIEKSCQPNAWNRTDFYNCLKTDYQNWGLFSCDDAVELLVGYLIFSHVFNESQILNLCIRPTFQRQGLASQLLKTLKTHLTEMHIDKLYLEVRESNKAAQTLYKQFGFMTIGRRKAYYPKPAPAEDALLMFTNLSQPESEMAQNN